MFFFTKNETRLLKDLGPHSPKISMIWPIAIVVLGLGLTLGWLGLLLWLPLRLLHFV
jgi:hypothetical protein